MEKKMKKYECQYLHDQNIIYQGSSKSAKSMIIKKYFTNSFRHLKSCKSNQTQNYWVIFNAVLHTKHE
jgi:hypothetical protein